MRALLLAAAAAGAAAQSCSTGCCTCTKGQNNAGKDLSQSVGVASPDACCSLCKAAGAACTGYVYIDTGVCYLKSTWVGPFPDTGVVGSGIPLAVCPTPNPATPPPVSPTPPPAPPAQVYGCDNATGACNPVSSGTPGASSKDVCTKTCGQAPAPTPPPADVYACDPGTLTCKVAPPGTPGAASQPVCVAACKATPAPPPPGPGPTPPTPPAPVPCDECGCLTGCSCQVGQNNARPPVKIVDKVPFLSECCQACRTLAGCTHYVYTNFRCYLSDGWQPYDAAGIFSGAPVSTNATGL